MIEIHTELFGINKRIILSIDGLKVNGLKTLTTISHNIQYQTAQYVIESNSDIFEELVKEVHHTYMQGDFVIVETHCNNDFRKYMDDFARRQEPLIIVNYASSNEHVPRVERNNRTIQERVR